MRHCLIMTAYKDAEMINSIIDETPVSWGVYIHIDAKSSLLSSMINNSNCYKKISYILGWNRTFICIYRAHEYGVK